MNITQLAQRIARDSIIEYTKTEVLSPDEAEVLSLCIEEEAFKILANLTVQIEDVSN